MNKCFLIGNITEVGKFKFILDSKHKSEITMKIKTLDGNQISIITYDDTADYILRKNFLNKTVLIQGRVTNKPKGMCIIANYIKEIFKNETKGVV